MHRSTVGGKVRPSKKTTAAVTPLKYHCYNHPPFEEREYCLFSLKVVLHSIALPFQIKMKSHMHTSNFCQLLILAYVRPSGMGR